MKTYRTDSLTTSYRNKNSQDFHVAAMVCVLPLQIVLHISIHPDMY